MADIFFSAPRIADHQTLCREERMQAEALRDAVRALGRADQVAADDRYRQLLRKVNKLYDYVQEMSRVTDHLEDETNQLLRRIHRIIQEATEKAKAASDFHF